MGFSSLVECWWNEGGYHVVVWLGMYQMMWVDAWIREILEESRYAWYTSYWFCGHDIEYIYKLQPRGKEKKYIAFHACSCSVLYCTVFRISSRNNFSDTERMRYILFLFWWWWWLLLLHLFCCTILVLFYEH